MEKWVRVYISNEGDAATARDPAYHGMRKYLWGNVPAVDMLKRSHNEGNALPEQLRLLFAGTYLII